MVDIVSNLNRVREEISTTARECGRDPSDIRLLAATKIVSAEQIQTACDAGHTLFGENRVQEAERKIPVIRADEIEWHLIGPLQSNKARRAVEHFDAIQTLDRGKIVRKVNDHAVQLEKRLPVFIEVNIGEEPQKHGVVPAKLAEMVKLVDSMPALELRGLMSIPPYHENPESSRPYFKKMRELLEGLNGSRTKPLRELSMGMSHDYRVAIEEGATLIRLGTAIFGARKE